MMNSRQSLCDEGAEVAAEAFEASGFTEEQ
jgi:hypothetical protein